MKASASIKLSSPPTQEFWEVPVLFEDEHVLALDKPSALLVSPDRTDPNRPSLLKLLHTGIAEGKPWAQTRNLSYLMNAHRLDFETSGVLLLAKNKSALVNLANTFGAEKPCLRYLAMVQGMPTEDRFEIEAKLASNPLKPGQFRVDAKGGKRSRTCFEVVEKFRGWTLLKCEPLTDRPHQVRVHLRYANLPVAGDDLYGGRPLLLSRLKPGFRLKPHHTERPLLSRATLHAEELALPHPVTAEPLKLVAPWPKDLKVAVKYLRQYAPV